MKFQDALLAGPDDRLPIEIDRRLRRRLGLESGRAASPRSAWLRPAIAGFALAAAVVVAIVIYSRPSEPSQQVVAGFVDVSKASWLGTVKGNEIDVRDDSPTSATVTWANAAIVAAPGTRVTTTSAQSLVLTRGAIQIKRGEATPMFVDVPVGRVVIAAYRSSVTTNRESVTILLDDGTGHYVDPRGNTHPLVPNTPLVFWPERQADTNSAPPTPPTPPTIPPSPTRPRTTVRSVGDGVVAPAPDASEPIEQGGPPGETPPRRPDVACTFKSDCDPGATCRKNEDGDSVCMGNGAVGAACWFDSDCQSQRCVQRRCASAPSTDAR